MTPAGILPSQLLREAVEAGVLSASQPVEEDLTAILDATKRAAQAAQTIITQGVEGAMNEFNSTSA